MTPPSLEFPTPGADELLGEDWFGEGSVFDSGENLASALAALASGEMVWPVDALELSGVSLASDARDSGFEVEAPAGWPPGATATPSQPPEEFQIATMPSARGGPPTGWALRAPVSVRLGRRLGGATMPERSGWSIRQSVQVLRMTEDTLYRLREEAAQLTWQLAALAHREIDA
ncbi:MAG: hypothetical protein ABR950_03885 [Candidatus Dormibacteria bacterium]|jgi:hypothetical protein